MKKRILSIMLSICMVLTLAPQAVFAESTVQTEENGSQEIVAGNADDASSDKETPDTAVIV